MLVTFRLATLDIGGTERVFLSVADFLSTTYGWQINFVIDRIKGNETEKVAISKGYKVVGLGVNRSWKAIVPFTDYLKQNKPDLVFSAYTETNAAAILSNALNRFRTPLIATEHSSLDEAWRDKSALRKLMREIMVRYIYRFADHVLCVSRGLTEQISKRLNHAHIGYIYNPTRFARRSRSRDEARVELGIAQNTRMILAVGRICKQKNYLMMIEAFSKLNRTDNYHLYIVGGIFEPEEKVLVDQMIERYGIGEYIHFVGFTNEVHAYYEAADLLVLSSAWEGFGNVLVEAMAFGLPVVSTRCNYGPAEILADGQFGILVDVDDSTAMQNGIQHIFEQNGFAAATQMQRAETFSESRVGEEYYHLVQSTIGRKS